MVARRKTQAERRNDSEQRLLAAAIRIISEQGYDSLRLADLGTAAGVSRGLAAHYFGTRSLLLARVVDTILKRTSAYVEEGSDLSLDPLQRVYDRIRLYGERWASGQEDGRALLAVISAAPWDESLKPLVAAHNQAVIDWFAENLRRAARTGRVPEDIDPDTEARMIFAFVRGLGSFRGSEVEYIVNASDCFIKNISANYESVKKK